MPRKLFTQLDAHDAASLLSSLDLSLDISLFLSTPTPLSGQQLSLLDWKELQTAFGLSFGKAKKLHRRIEMCVEISQEIQSEGGGEEEEGEESSPSHGGGGGGGGSGSFKKRRGRPTSMILSASGLSPRSQQQQQQPQQHGAATPPPSHHHRESKLKKLLKRATSQKAVHSILSPSATTPPSSWGSVASLPTTNQSSSMPELDSLLMIIPPFLAMVEKQQASLQAFSEKFAAERRKQNAEAEEGRGEGDAGRKDEGKEEGKGNDNDNEEKGEQELLNLVMELVKPILSTCNLINTKMDNGGGGETVPSASPEKGEDIHDQEGGGIGGNTTPLHSSTSGSSSSHSPAVSSKRRAHAISLISPRKMANKGKPSATLLQSAKNSFKIRSVRGSLHDSKPQLLSKSGISRTTDVLPVGSRGSSKDTHGDLEGDEGEEENWRKKKTETLEETRVPPEDSLRCRARAQPSLFDPLSPPLPVCFAARPAPAKSSTSSVPPSSSAPSTSSDVELERRQHRKAVLRELWETEVAYVNDVHLIIQFFYHPLMNSNMLTKEQTEEIFGNICEILELTKRHIQRLYGQLMLPPKKQRVGAAFKESLVEFKSYKVYCANQGHASECLNRCTIEVPFFKAWIQGIESVTQSNKGKLKSLLIRPVQRLCRYPLLLKELASNMPANHPDRETILEAKASLENLITEVNEIAHHTDNVNFTKDLYSKIEWGDFSTEDVKTKMTTGGIQSIRHGKSFLVSYNAASGILPKKLPGRTSKKDHKVVMLHLLTDYFFINKILKKEAREREEKEEKLMHLISLDKVLVWDVENDPSGMHCFSLVRLDAKHKLVLGFESAAEKSVWMEVLNANIGQQI